MPDTIVTARGRVAVRVTSELLLGHLLRLPAGTSLTGAEADHMGTDGDGNAALVLHLEMDGVPEGADEAEPQYTRDASIADPVKFTGIRWCRRGLDLDPEAAGG